MTLQLDMHCLYCSCLSLHSPEPVHLSPLPASVQQKVVQVNLFIYIHDFVRLTLLLSRPSLTWLRHTPLHLSASTAWVTLVWWPTCLWITRSSPGVKPGIGGTYLLK